MTVNLPTSWNDVTVAEWQALRELIKNKKEGTPENDFLLECAIISTLSGAEMDTLMALTRDSHARLMKELAFLKQPITGKVKQRVRVGKQWYFLEKYAENVTGGQFIDLMSQLKDQDKIDENLHKILACFAVKMKWGIFKQKYNGKDFEQAANDFKRLPIGVVKPLTDFFLKHYLDCAKITVQYLEKEAKKIKRQAEKEQKLS